MVLSLQFQQFLDLFLSVFRAAETDDLQWVFEERHQRRAQQWTTEYLRNLVYEDVPAGGDDNYNVFDDSHSAEEGRDHHDTVAAAAAASGGDDDDDDDSMEEDEVIELRAEGLFDEGTEVVDATRFFELIQSAAEESGGNMDARLSDIFVQHLRSSRYMNKKLQLAKLFLSAWKCTVADSYHMLSQDQLSYLKIVSHFYAGFDAPTAAPEDQSLEMFELFRRRRVAFQRLLSRRTGTPIVFQFPLMDMPGSVNSVYDEPLSSRRMLEKDWRMLFQLLDCYVPPIAYNQTCISRVWDDLVFNERIKDTRYLRIIEQALQFLDVDPRVGDTEWAKHNPREAMMKKSPLVMFKDVNEYLAMKREHEERMRLATTTPTTEQVPGPMPIYEEFSQRRLRRHRLRDMFDSARNRKPTTVKVLFVLIASIRTGNEHRLAQNYLHLIGQHVSREHTDRCLFSIFLLDSIFGLLKDNTLASSWLLTQMSERLAKLVL